MAENIVSGMFGLTPMQLQQQRQQETNSAASDFAHMNAAQRGVMGLYQGGAGIGGMLGLKDPQMEQAQQSQAMQQGIDLTTPEGLKAAALKFQQAGNMNAAVGLLEKSRQLENDAVAAKYKGALADKALSGGEYERMMAVLLDPESTEEEKVVARNRITALNAKATNSGRGAGGSSQFKTGADGLVYEMVKGGANGETITRLVMKPDGTPLQAAEASPDLKAKMSGAAAGATEVGKVAGQAQVTVPDMELQITQAQHLGDQLFSHPGFASAVGVGIPYASQLTGTQEKGFMALHKQIVSGAFLQSAQQMRGLGQLTEVEGTKATAAANRMDAATNEADYRKAYEDYMLFMNQGLAKLKAKAGMSFQMPTGAPAAAAAPVPQFSGVTSPAQVRAMFKAGRLNRDQAKTILADMQSQGLF